MEALDEDQLFVAELARDLERVCQVMGRGDGGRGVVPVGERSGRLSSCRPLHLQRSAVLEHIWKQDDVWPAPLCRTFLWQWASVLETREVRDISSRRKLHSPFLTGARVSAEEAPSDGRLAGDERAQTGRADGRAGRPAGQGRDPQLDQGPEGSARGAASPYACAPSSALAPSQGLDRLTCPACSKACGPENPWPRSWRTCSRRGAGAAPPICWRLWRWSCGRWRCSSRIRFRFRLFTFPDGDVVRWGWVIV